MRLNTLNLLNFRNYTTLTFKPGEGLNFLFGFNAQGKTNLVESIYFLATARSYRSNRDQDLLRWESQYFKVHGLITNRSRQTELEIDYQENGKKTVKLSGVKQSRLPDYLGSLSVVLFSPEELAIVKGSPRERRRFLDMQISQLSKSYAFLLIQYYKILSQRNMLLKSCREKPQNKGQLEVWDSQLIANGSKILAKRFEIIKKLAFLARSSHRKIAAGKENLEIKYLCSLQAKPDMALEEIENSFRVKLEELRQEEIGRGLTLAGPHRDDLVFYLNGSDVKSFGSQGQQRSTALSLKLAELELHYAVSGDYPVLLLDDVLSELDSLRRHYLLASVQDKVQTFITATNLEHIDQRIIADAKVFMVDAGKLK